MEGVDIEDDGYPLHSPIRTLTVRVCCPGRLWTETREAQVYRILQVASKQDLAESAKYAKRQLPPVLLVNQLGAAEREVPEGAVSAGRVCGSQMINKKGSGPLNTPAKVPVTPQTFVCQLPQTVWNWRGA